MTEPVDLTDLREMTEGDAEMEKELFEEFFSSSEECIATMEANCADGINEPFRAGAHALKGTAINLGATRLSELCKTAQESHAVSAEEKKGLVDGIKNEYSQVKSFLEGVIGA